MKRHVPAFIALSLLLALVTTRPLCADKSLAGRACRSVHLGYPAPLGEAFYCEVKVEKSAPGSYFMVCGWNTGYFGIQEIGPDKKVAIFSVWDASKGNNPADVPDNTRVQVLHEGEDVHVSRFGGEGTGGKCMFDYNWQVGQTYRCLVTAKPDGNRTQYAGYFYLPDQKQWKHLVTFSTITGGQNLRGYYSFIEDFRRNGVSATQPRRAEFGDAWVKNIEGKWMPLDRARFTGDSNPATNIDAGISDSMFYLATGGETKNGGTKLRSYVQIPHESIGSPPDDLPSQK